MAHDLAAHPSHLVSVLGVVLMYAVLLTGIPYQTLKKQLILAWDTAGILLVLLTAIGLIFMLRAG